MSTTTEFSATALPPPPPFETWPEYQPTCLSAYNIVLEAEFHAVQQVEANPASREAKNNVVFARVAGYLFIELFRQNKILGGQPCTSLTKELISSLREPGQTYDVVFRIGKRYRDYLLRLFRTSTTKYPTPSLHPSRPSFDTLEDMTKDCMMADGKDYPTARRKALTRDGFRCILTGAFDETSVRHNRELYQQRRHLGAALAVVQACHILNESTMQGIDPTGGSESEEVTNKTSFAVTAISILRDFGLEPLVQELLEEGGVHGLGNLLSLEPTTHTYFDNLCLWFEATDKPNCYNVCVSDPGYEVHLYIHKHLQTDGGRLSVTFTSPNEALLRVPDPQLLALHAACARVAHMSGAAEVFDELERDIEDTRVLAFDGSSAHLLDHCLTPFAVIPGVAH